MRPPGSGIAYALIAALLFGASTPLAKLLLHDVPPLLLAGLLYAGSGLGLLIVLTLREIRAREPLRGRARLNLHEAGWLAGAIFAGA